MIPVQKSLEANFALFMKNLDEYVYLSKIKNWMK